MPRIKGESFAEALGGLLDEYHGMVISRVNEAGQNAVKEIERITKHTSPKRTGKYRRAIRSGIKEERRTGTVYAWYVQDPHYRLTHLLAHGHRTRRGGHTRPNPFLENGVNEVLPKYERAVIDAVKKEST